MLDHVAAIILAMLIRLHCAVRIFRSGQQSVFSRLLRRKPIKLPASPRMLLRRVQKVCLRPGSATVSTHSNLSHFALARPCSSENCAYLVSRCPRYPGGDPINFAISWLC